MLAEIGDKEVDELDTLEFTATATDADLPVQTLVFSLALVLKVKYRKVLPLLLRVCLLGRRLKRKGLVAIRLMCV